MVSYGKSVQDNRLEVVSMDFIVDMIRSDKALKDKISFIRKISDNQLRQQKKKEILPIFNPGIFKGNVRKNENLEEIEYLTFDFDHLNESEYKSVLEKLKGNKHTFLIFHTPSGGQRLKALFRLDSPLHNQKAYEAIYLYYLRKLSQTLGVEIDQSYKNSQLGSFLSYDPEIFHNPEALRLPTGINFQEAFRSAHIPEGGEYNDLSNLSAAAKFLRHKISCYTEYCIIMYSLASLGETGRNHFITICSDHPNYPKDTQEELSKEFDRALKTYDPDRSNRIRINSLFYLAKKKGFIFPKKTFDFTEMGLSERMSYYFNDKLKHSGEFHRWLIWNGKKWEEDKTGMISDFYKKMLQRLSEEMRSVKEPERQKKMKQHIRSARSRRALENVLHILKSDSKTRISAAQMDSDGELFNCDNKIIQLCEGKVAIADHSPEFLITKITKASIDPKSQCPKWMEFLHTTFKSDMSMIDFIQRTVGYCLTSKTTEEVIFYLYGEGANGKTVFIETLNLLLGDYFLKTPIETFLSYEKVSAGQASPELVMLKGVRLVVGSEVPENKSLNEKLIKDLTGGDCISPRPLYGEFITFKPVCKIMLYGNHRPQLKSADNGIRRRLLLIPFENVIPKEKRRDKSHMLSEFECELSGILNWALEGYRNWHKCGLNPPEKIRATTETYFSDNDSLQNFIDESCKTSQSFIVPAQDFYSHFKDYLTEKGEYIPPAKRVYEKLREKGFSVKSGTANKTYVFGLSMISEEIQVDFN